MVNILTRWSATGLVSKRLAAQRSEETLAHLFSDTGLPTERTKAEV